MCGNFLLDMKSFLFCRSNSCIEGLFAVNISFCKCPPPAPPLLHPHMVTGIKAAELGTLNLFSFATAHQSFSDTKNSKKIKTLVFQWTAAQQIQTQCNNQPFLGLKTRLQCRGSVVACPALEKPTAIIISNYITLIQL